MAQAAMLEIWEASAPAKDMLHLTNDRTQTIRTWVVLAGKGPGPCLREEATAGAGHIQHNSCDTCLSNPATPQPHAHVLQNKISTQAMPLS